MAQLIATTGIVAEIDENEMFLIAHALLARQQALSEQPQSEQRDREMHLITETCKKFRAVTIAEVQEIKASRN